MPNHRMFHDIISVYICKRNEIKISKRYKFTQYFFGLMHHCKHMETTYVHFDEYELCVYIYVVKRIKAYHLQQNGYSKRLLSEVKRATNRKTGATCSTSYVKI